MSKTICMMKVSLWMCSDINVNRVLFSSVFYSKGAKSDFNKNTFMCVINVNETET